MVVNICGGRCNGSYMVPADNPLIRIIRINGILPILVSLMTSTATAEKQKNNHKTFTFIKFPLKERSQHQTLFSGAVKVIVFTNLRI